MSAGDGRGSAAGAEAIRQFLERRERALRELAAGLAVLEQERAIPERAVEVLSRFSSDLPFLMFYRLEAPDTHYRLAAEFGTGGKGLAAAAEVSPDADAPWSFAEALRSRRIVEQEIAGDEDEAEGGEGPRNAFVVPIDPAGEDSVPLVLIAGVPGRFSAAQEHREFQELVRVLLSGAVQAVRARETAVAAADAAAERERLFVAEFQHGIRNMLAVMRSIVRRTAEASLTVDDFAMHLEGRIDALARVQSAAARSPMLGIDLASIVAEELLTVAAQEDSNLTIEGPPVRLRPKAAGSFALTIHELATNALKYGALSVDSGHITVRWTLGQGADAPLLDFRWRERGLRDLPANPTRNGFGTELLKRTLSYELKAETRLSYEPDGLKCRIMLPLERVLAGNGTDKD